MMVLNYLIKYKYLNDSLIMEYRTMSNNKNSAIENFLEYLKENNINHKFVEVVSCECDCSF